MDALSLDDFIAQAHQTLAEYGLDKTGWKVALDNGKTRAGACHYRTKTISFSWAILQKGSYAEQRETILHEVAHALTPGHKHDLTWKAKLLSMGGTGSRTHKMETVKGRYEIHCEACGVIGTRHQRQGSWKFATWKNRYYTHKGCGAALELRDTKAMAGLAPKSFQDLPIIEVGELATAAQKKAAQDDARKITAPEKKHGDLLPEPGVGPSCRCACGGRTKGGAYLPGHDARHVSAVFAEWLASGVDTDLAVARFAHAPKLAAKLQARIAAYAEKNYK